MRTPDVVEVNYFWGDRSAAVSVPINALLTEFGVTVGRCSGLKKKYQRQKITNNLQAMTTAISRSNLEFGVFLSFVFIVWTSVDVSNSPHTK